VLALVSGAISGLASKKPSAMGQGLFPGPGGGRDRVCAGAGVFEGQVGAVDGEQVVGASEVLRREDDVAALAAEAVNLVAAQLPPRARAVASLQAATADRDCMQGKEASDAQQIGNLASDWSSTGHVVGRLW
jgi:hypothetical protein